MRTNPEVNPVIAATSGCFDIIHAGHVHLFRCMRDAAGPKGMVVVLLNDDDYLRRAKGRVIVHLEQRLAVLLAMRDIDMVIPFEEDDPALIISRMEPTFWYKGPEYWGIMDLPEREAVESCGGKMVFATCGPDVHTSEIIKRIKAVGQPHDVEEFYPRDPEEFFPHE